jgi:hypothetical protein
VPIKSRASGPRTPVNQQANPPNWVYTGPRLTDLCWLPLCDFPQNIAMKGTPVFVALALVVMTAHRLPAPISEESPTPRPKSQSTAAPPKKEEAKPASQRNAFDGTWVGTENLGSVGTIQSTQVISGSGTMARSRSKLGTFTWNATCNGKTMRWSVNTQYGSGVRTFTPNPDGKTALMIFESGVVHSSATFYRTLP